jgi:hypothetical protein
MKNFKILVLMLGLGLCGNAKAQTFRYSAKSKNGPIMIVAGVTLTTASIVQNYSDGVYVNTYPNYYGNPTLVYNPPNILTNPPVNVMFGVGVTLTITGLISTITLVK